MDLIIFIQGFSSSFLDFFFQLVTMMGEDLFIMAMVGIIFWCIDKKFAYFLAFAYLTTGFINTFLKEIFRVPRLIGEPGVRSLRVETAGGYSFPSGHSQCGATFWTTVMLKIKKRWFYILSCIMMLLVGFSRLYLGVHRPVDVIFGLLLGFTWVFPAKRLFHYLEESNSHKTVSYIALPIIIGMFFIQTGTYYKVAGTIFALLIGYIVENKYIHYKEKAPLLFQFIKLIIGFTVMLIIKEGIKALLPVSIWSNFFRYLIIGLWLTIGSTYLFNRFIPVVERFFEGEENVMINKIK